MAQRPPSDSERQEAAGREFERHRLEHRARRLRLVVAALRERAGEAATSGHVPPPLHRALSDFSNELAHVRARLGEPHLRSKA
jgi:hypothetical protein